jgi:N-acetylglutamate synthase-like GNAT family acetyltransferase
VNIRSLRESDNSQLIDLAKSIGVPARVKLGVDRAPSFWAFDEMLGGRWDILVAEINQKIVGFIDMIHTEFLIGKMKKRVTYVGLAGVDHAWRGSTVFHRLLRASEKTARACGSEFALALVNRNNDRLDKLLHLVYRDSIRCDELRVFCILLGPHYRQDRSFMIETAKPEDLSRIVQLVKRYYDNYQIAPLFREDYCRGLLKNELSDFLVARDSRNTVVATLGLWDQGRIRRTVLVDYTFPESWLRNILNCSRDFTRIKRIPPRGGHFSYLHSILAAAEGGYEGALAALIRFACNRYVNRKYNFLIYAVPESSPFIRFYMRLWRIVNINIPVVIPLTPGARKLLHDVNPRSLFLEYALA